MEGEVRDLFNEAWTPELYRRVREDLDRRLDCKVPFPVAESPLFLSEGTLRRFGDAAEEILAQLSDPAYLKKAESSIPEPLRDGPRGPLPQCAQIDFAIVRGPDGSLQPRLVELQGFPSLYAFQIALADVWATVLPTLPGLARTWKLFFSGLDRYRALALLREAIVGDHDPEEVILLDIDPDSQKTYPDFAATQRWFGVDPVCVTKVIRDGDRLWRWKKGRRLPIRRVYQRVVFDELERKKIRLPYEIGAPMEVEWAPHPAWYYAWSKNSLPDIDHPAAPRTLRLSAIDGPPEDLSSYVLKPLYSFAGGGVNVDPTPKDIAAIPREQREGWVLQQKITYHPGLRTVDGNLVMGEVRMMFVRPDNAQKMTLLLNLVRLSRGKMMGVDFNKNLDWTGSSVAIWA